MALFGVIHVILFYSRRLRISTGFIRINVNKTRISGLIRSLRKKHPTFEDESHPTRSSNGHATVCNGRSGASMPAAARNGHVTATWRSRGGHVAATWRLRGSHVASAWPARGGKRRYMTVRRPLHDSYIRGGKRPRRYMTVTSGEGSLRPRVSHAAVTWEGHGAPASSIALGSRVLVIAPNQFRFPRCSW